MDPSRWKQIEELYHATLERASGHRTAFLDTACGGDEELRHAVEALLAQSSSEPGTLDQRVWAGGDPTVTLVTPGTRLGPYRIEGPLGKGGMGEVFRGLDTRLNRPVAIKASSAQFDARFKREAHAIAAINHPHICTLYDVGPNYLVMELVEGETLAAALKRGALPMGQVLRFGAQIADALAAAHAKGVIHRDLKPGNVMLGPNGVKVLDFGLAKTETDGTLTSAGVVMGTPGYMSPEQAAGGPPDKAGDIFSFGILLHEMLSGERPFDGANGLETMQRILHSAPKPLSADVPEALRKIVGQCLVKAPEQRYASARRLEEDLRQLSQQYALPAIDHRPPSATSRYRSYGAFAIAVLAVIAAGVWYQTHRASTANSSGNPITSQRAFVSLAILPFTSLSPDPANEYLAEGVTQEVSSSVSSLSQLRVVVGSSVSQFKDKGAGAHEIGEKLGVDAVLEGSVRRDGNHLRVTTQLSNTKDGFLYWSRSWDRDIVDTFAVQREIGEAVAGALGAGGSPPSTGRHIPKPEAYQKSLQASFLSARQLYKQAIVLFEEAVRLDPEYADAHAMLGQIYASAAALHVVVPTDKGFALAKQHAARALELDPEAWVPLATQGLASALQEHDPQAAERFFQRALAKAPKGIQPGLIYSWFLSGRGRWQEVWEYVDQATSIEPFSPTIKGITCYYRLVEGNSELAIPACEASLAGDPDNPLRLFWMRSAYETAHRIPDAIATAREYESTEAVRQLEAAFKRGGEKAYFQASGDLLAQAQEDPLHHSYLAAIAYAHCSPKQAIEMLERAFTEHSPELHEMVVEAAFASLHNNPTFKDLARRLNLPSSTKP